MLLSRHSRRIAMAASSSSSSRLFFAAARAVSVRSAPAIFLSSPPSSRSLSHSSSLALPRGGHGGHDTNGRRDVKATTAAYDSSYHSYLAEKRRRRRAYFSSSTYAASSCSESYSAAATEALPTLSPPPFSKVLVANRGEIALRVMETCRRLGISTVAIHSTVDVRSPHVAAADEAICVGPASSSSSYLNVDAVCDAIRRTGAQAVHPGYGFLSENADFARKVSDMGVAFVGPSADAIVAMGDKIQSKKLARDAGVNVIPGFDGVIHSADEAVRIAQEIGFPVMVKAAAGGGGKGMRICRTPEQVAEGYLLSTAEAKSFFSDDRIFIERYIENPHHIEFQVLAGRKKTSGSESEDEVVGPLEILVFPERECSIQRRNQKIIEESPSVLLTPETRANMVRQVKSLVRTVEYHSAGTVEFLVDENQNFYFLEMNTRLQVEHPVTEMVSGGIDLVKGMIDVAGGRGIPEEYLALVGGGAGGAGGDDDDGRVVPHVGHAIEARVYAEDPFRGFLPSIGPLLTYVEPTPRISRGPPVDGCTHTAAAASERGGGGGGCIVRVDSGVVEGTRISQYYDPMISKLVAYSPNSRMDAIGALGKALDKYVIRGVGHNSSFVSDVLRHPEFQMGNTPTNFIERHYPDGFKGVCLMDEEREELAAIGAEVGRARVISRGDKRERKDVGSEDEEDVVVVCLGGMFGDAYRVRREEGGAEGRTTIEKIVRISNEEKRESDISTSVDGDGHSHGSDEGGGAAPTHAPRAVSVSIRNYDPVAPVLDVIVDGSDRSVQVEGEDNVGTFVVRMYGADVTVLVMSPREFELSLWMKSPLDFADGGESENFVQSPMPGTLISYAVQGGQRVEVGQELCVVEAMKMQNVIRSERAGVIKSLNVEVGASVMADEVIVEFEKEE